MIRYRSLDGGLSWTAVGAPPGAPALRDVIVDRRGDVYVSSNLGVWRYTTPACDMAINGGIEGEGGWELPEMARPAGYADRLAYGGTRSLRIGIDNGANVFSYSPARQAVAIPAGGHVYAVSGEAVQIARDQACPERSEWAFGRGTVASALDQAVAQDGDAQYLLLLDPDSGAIVQVLFWELSNAQRWQFRTFDLSAYAGRTIALHFGVYNDGAGGRTGMYVDNDQETSIARTLYSPGNGLANPLDIVGSKWVTWISGCWLSGQTRPSAL